MPPLGGGGVAVTFSAPVAMTSVPTASSATNRHFLARGGQDTALGFAVSLPRQTLTAPVEAVMTAPLPKPLVSEPVETQDVLVGQASVLRLSRPCTVPAGCAALAGPLIKTAANVKAPAAATSGMVRLGIVSPPFPFGQYGTSRPYRPWVARGQKVP